MKRSCIIVDDEKLAREKITLYLEHTGQAIIRGSYATGQSFLRDWKHTQHQLIFLDINLPDLNGLELATIIQKGNQIIFTTAYAEHALQGFELDAIDYLLKPFTMKRFLRAFTKAQQSCPIENYLYIKEGKKTHRLSYQEINYIEGLKEYVIWHTQRGKIVTYDSLKHLVQQLQFKGFFQVHKSYIVNFSKIDCFEPNSIHLNDIELPIGRKFKAVVTNWLM